MSLCPLPTDAGVYPSGPNSGLAFLSTSCIMVARGQKRVLWPMPRQTIYGHKLVVDTAVQMAHELYDSMMMQNQWWEEWKQLNPDASRYTLEKRFVEKNLPLLVPQARAALAKCLAPGQAPGLTERQKEEIAQALILDNQLVAARAAASQASRDRIRIN